MSLPIKWSDFLEQLQEAGYEGPDDDLVKVKAWLRSKGHSTETVEIGDGDTVPLEELYNSRPGRPLNASAAADKAKFREAVEQQATKWLDELQTAGVIHPGPDRSNPTNPPKHDVTVGKDRLAYDGKGGFKDFGHFCKAVVTAGSEGKGQPEELDLWRKATLSTYGSEGVGTDGGFTVPPTFVDAIWKVVSGEDTLLSRCRQFTLAGNSIRMPMDDDEPWSSSGITGTWEGEAQAMTQKKPVFKERELRLRKYTVLVPLTDELIEDSGAMTQYVTSKASEKISFAVDESIVRGTGAGQPYGFTLSSSFISVAKETAQVKTTIHSRNIFKMYSRMYGPFRRNAVWLINQDAESELYSLTIAAKTAAGTTSGGGPVYVPPGGAINASPLGTLMGRPVLPTQHCATLGTVQDIMLVDLSQYIVAMKGGGIQSATSMHLWFDQAVTALRFVMRLDGQPALEKTITPRTGSNTMSAFVALATRS